MRIIIKILKKMKKIKIFWGGMIKWWRVFDSAHIDTLLGRVGYLGSGLFGTIALLLLTDSVITLLKLIHITDFIRGGDKVKEYIYIFYLSSPLMFILWMLRTRDKLKSSNESHYFNALNLLSKKDEPRSWRLAFKILLDLRKKGIYREEIKNIFSGLDLSNINLESMDLSGLNLKNVNFTGANLTKVDFTGSNLIGVRYYDNNTSLHKQNHAQVYGANFSNTKFDFAYFSFDRGVRSKFKGVDLRDAKILVGQSDIKEIKNRFINAYYNYGTEFSRNRNKLGSNLDLDFDKEIKKVMIKK